MVIRKEVRKTLIVLLIAALVLAALSAFLLWRALRDDSLDRAPFALVIRDEKTVLWRGEKGGEVTPGTQTWTLSWKEKKGGVVRLISSGAFLGQVNLVPGEERTVTVAPEKAGPLTVVVLPEKGVPTVFLASQADLTSSLIYLTQGGDLVCLAPTELGDLVHPAPVRLFGNFHFDSLTVDTSLSGRVAIAPDQAFTAPLTVFAPECPLTLRDFTPACGREEYPYYLRVPSVNRRACFTGAVPLDSEKKLTALFSHETLPRLVSGDTLLITRALRLRRNLTFDGLLSFDLRAPLTAGLATIRLATREEGEIRITLADGVDLAPALLDLDTPGARVTFTAAVPPALTVAQRLWNMESYNGESPALGGKGTSVPVLTLPRTEGVLLRDVVFTAAGNTLTGVVPYDLTEGDLAQLPYTLTAGGGTAVLEDGVSSAGVVTATDQDGQTRRFALVFLREAKNIPAVYLETDGKAEITSRTKYTSGLFSMDPGKSGYDAVDLTHIRVRGRGNSTWKWEKKPYKIHFDKPTSLLGLPPAEEWALLANYADKSLMRNRLALVMASELSFAYTPTQVLVDLFLNGEYQGVYSLGEHLEAGPGRVEVRHDMRNKDCGYFLEVGGVVSGVDVKGMDYFHAGLLKFVLIKDPDYNELTTLQFNYIRDYLLEADAAIKAGAGWEDYMDIDTLVDWMIMTELSFNTDCSWRRSTYMTKNPGEKVKMGTVWDFDLAFGNFSKDVQAYDVWVSTNEEDKYVGTTWSTYLLKDPVFQKAFKARWDQVRDRLLATAFREIDSTYEAVLPSAEANFERWDILGRKVAFERRDTNLYPTYDSQIGYLKNFLTRRAAWIDRAVADWDVE